MKFIHYLNESYEDKIFTLIDQFMQSKHLTTGKEVLDSWNLLINYAGDTFGVNIMTMPAYDNKLSGRTDDEGILIRVPGLRDKLSDRLKADMLGTLFHELAHKMQEKSWSGMFMDYRNTKGDDEGLTGYSDYFLQKTERPSQAISMAIAAVVSGKDVIGDLQKVKSDAQKAKTFKDANDAVGNRIAEYSDLEDYENKILKSLFLVCGFTHSLHLQTTDNPKLAALIRKKKQEFENKWNRFEKLFVSSYRKLHAYFKRYGII